MKRIICFTICIFLFISLIAVSTARTEDASTIKLPPAKTEGGKPLMQALKERHTTRDYKPDKLSYEVMSNLLWAAFGINRMKSGKRTAPSARNWQEIDIYVALEDGLYLYQPKAHALKLVLHKDVRRLTGGQAFVETAPLNLVYVADHSKIQGADEKMKEFYSATDTGFIAQNVYLFCASEGLGTVVRGYVDRPALAKAMKLEPHQVITLAQTVGYPANQ